MEFKSGFLVHELILAFVERFIRIHVEVKICHNLFSGLFCSSVADICCYLMQFTFLLIAFEHTENALFARRWPFLLCIMKPCPLYICSVKKAHDPVINFIIKNDISLLIIVLFLYTHVPYNCLKVDVFKLFKAKKSLVEQP